MTGYKTPQLREGGFTCPHCGVLAQQLWQEGVFSIPFRTTEGHNFQLTPPRFTLSKCTLCQAWCVWHEEQMVYPIAAAAPLPNSDIPDDAKVDFLEARSIASLSPRGAAALLRLAVQKLCKHLGESGKNINDDVASLVRKGLDVRVQQALDVVRVIGNNAVHPGQIDLNDDPARAQVLFSVVNEIVEEMISKPKRAQELFDKLPEEAKEAIARRDAKSSQRT